MKRTVTAAVTLILGLLVLFSGCVPAGRPSGGTDADGTAAPVETATPQGTRPPAKENVAKIILVMGQSNGIGSSLYEPLKKNIDSEAFKRASRGYDNVRIVYYAGETTATNFSAKRLDGVSVRALFDKVRFGKTLSGGCFGPEMGIAEAFNQAFPDDTLYIIKVGRGGTPISPSFLEGGALYEKAVEIVEGCCGVLEREGYSPEIISICWMQGENEALALSTAQNYKNDLAAMVSLLRKTFGKYAPYGGIPFIDAGISSYWTYHETVNTLKKEYSETSDINYYFSTIDLGYTYDKEPAASPDLAHFDSESAWLLGQEFLKYALDAYEKVK